jgi:hypothetical protein
MTTSLVTSMDDGAEPVTSMVSTHGSIPSSLIPTSLVEQLADALGNAETRLAAAPRITIQPVTMQQSLRVAQPATYINAESAPFLLDPPAAASPPMLTAETAQHWLDQHYTTPATEQPPIEMSYHHQDDHDHADLPRFFDRDRVSAGGAADALSGYPSPTRAQSLSPAIMAFGFVVGLAVILPTLWLVNADKIARVAQRSAPLALAAPLIAASAVATLVPAAAYEIAERSGAAPSEAERAELAVAALEDASRRLAVGDYIGARDRLRQAVLYGEDRARALLDTLE